jgi:hypothetical protein
MPPVNLINFTCGETIPNDAVMHASKIEKAMHLHLISMKDIMDPSFSIDPMADLFDQFTNCTVTNGDVK